MFNRLDVFCTVALHTCTDIAIIGHVTTDVDAWSCALAPRYLDEDGASHEDIGQSTTLTDCHISSQGRYTQLAFLFFLPNRCREHTGRFRQTNGLFRVTGNDSSCCHAAIRYVVDSTRARNDAERSV